MFVLFIFILAILGVGVGLVFDKNPWLIAYVDFSEKGKAERRLIRFIEDCTVNMPENLRNGISGIEARYSIALAYSPDPNFFIFAKQNLAYPEHLEFVNVHNISSRTATTFNSDNCRVFSRIEQLVIANKRKTVQLAKMEKIHTALNSFDKVLSDKPIEGQGN